jgi:uncharacterized protein (TIGR02453 family)
MHLRELNAYLQGLAENNTKAWFVMNKPSYDILRGEFTELTAAVIARIAQFDPAVAGADAKKALFRIYRDVRFSKDKTPYKTTFSAAIAPSAAKIGGAMYYFQINDKNELLIAAGCYHPAKSTLTALRAAIARDPATFTRVVRSKVFVDAFGALDDEEALKRAPKGFAVDQPGIEFIKMKNIIAVKRTRLSQRIGRDLAGEIAHQCHAAYPLVRWVRRSSAGRAGSDAAGD